MLRYVDINKEKKDEEILSLLRPYVREWFKRNFRKFTLPQKFAIPLIHEKKNVLVTAPTGSGKTLCAFLAIINELFSLAEKQKLENKIYCIYVSPLRALDNDIRRNLLQPLTEIPEIAKEKFGKELQEVRIGLRTGDTLPSERQRQLRKPPHILVTTPETLAILLGTRKFKENLKGIKWVIIDEIHELANSKRGVHLSLSLERLQYFIGKDFVRIGLGATLEPLEEAAKFLVGLKNGRFRSCYIIDARFVKPIDIKVLVPSKDLIFESAESINRKMYELLDNLISKHRTTLVFTNTRSGAERVHFHLKHLFPSKYLDGLTGVHHSSVSREIRFEVEEKMKKGELKCAICVDKASEVLTERGWERIDKLKNGRTVVSLNDGLRLAKSDFEKIRKLNGKYEGFIIRTSSGFEVKATSDHYFLVLEDGVLKWKKAKELRKGDRVGVIRHIRNRTKELTLFDILRANKDLYVELKKSVLQDLREEIFKRFKTIKSFAQVIGLNYDKLLKILRGIYPVNIKVLEKIYASLGREVNSNDISYIRAKNYSITKVKNIKFNEKLARLFGYWLADGSWAGCSIRIFSSSEKLIKKYKKLVGDMFNCKIRKCRRNLFMLQISSKVCFEIFKKLVFPFREKGKVGKISPILYSLPLRVKSAFLSGYFDGDGYLEVKDGRVHSAGFTTFNENFAKVIKNLLLYFGIMSSIRRREYDSVYNLNGRFIKKKGTSFSVSVYGGVYLRKFSKLIKPFREPLKQIKNLKKGYCNLDVIPGVGRLLREIRHSLGISTYRLQKIKFYNPEKVEIGNRKISRRNLKRLIDFYEKKCDRIDVRRKLEFLKNLANSPVFWDEIISMKKIELETPYTLVNVENGNYIVNGFITKNSSTSLELGIDVGYIDLVVQIGSPKSVSRLMQRVGRAGHRLHEISKGRIICLDRDDLIECLVMAKKCYEYWLDKFYMPGNCLDVLAQHLAGMAIEKKWNVKEAFDLVRQAYPYKDLKFETFLRVLEYLAGHYHTLEDYSVYGKIWYDAKDQMFGRRGKYARVIYTLNIGTIPDEVKIKVKTLEGKFVGFIEEGFLERLVKGDIFVLGGKTYEFVKARRSTAYVKLVKEKRPTIPSWFSEQLPLSFDLALEIGKFREKMLKMIEKKRKKDVINFLKKNYLAREEVAKAVYDYFSLQLNFLKKFNVKNYPSDRVILVENVIERDAQNIVFHTLYGRRVNDALSRAFAYVLMKRIGRSIGVAISDNGFILTIPFETFDSRSWLSLKKLKKKLTRVDPREIAFLVNSNNFEEILKKAIANTELIKRKFRHCAARAFMILRNYKGYEISVEKQQMNAERLIRVVKKLEGFPILEETYREILEDFMDVENAKKILKETEKGRIKFEFLPESDVPSPFAHNLFVISESDVVLMEDRKKLLLELHRKVLNKVKV